jgi:hypothetical protein
MRRKEVMIQSLGVSHDSPTTAKARGVEGRKEKL